MRLHFASENTIILWTPLDSDCRQEVGLPTYPWRSSSSRRPVKIFCPFFFFSKLLEAFSSGARTSQHIHTHTHTRRQITDDKNNVKQSERFQIRKSNSKTNDLPKQQNANTVSHEIYNDGYNDDNENRTVGHVLVHWRTSVRRTCVERSAAVTVAAMTTNVRVGCQR